jgi:hypothetical protein
MTCNVIPINYLLAIGWRVKEPEVVASTTAKYYLSHIVFVYNEMYDFPRAARTKNSEYPLFPSPPMFLSTPEYTNE